MVKFKKLLESKKISQWKDKYINYKSLKQIINEIYIKLETSKIFYLNQNNNQKYSLNNDNYYYNRLNMDNKKVLNKFFNKLDTEIKLFYNGYISIERELFIRLNKFLSKKDLYKDMKFLIICNEIQEIYLFLVDTRFFSDYIFLNLEGIRKILKKFDKKLKKFYNNKSKILNYIRFLLEYNNSDLNYILQMKIIDEIILLSENLLNILKSQINKIKDENNYYNNEDITNLNNNINNNNNQELDNEIFLEALKKIEDSENNIKYNIEKIISNSYYRKVYINYGLYLNYESNGEDEKYIDPYIKNEEDFNYFRYIKQKEGNLILIKKFITNEGYNELIDDNKKIISDFNKKNIYLILFNVFLLNFFESNNLLIFIIIFIKDNHLINNNNNFFNPEFLICFSISLIYFGKIIGNIFNKFLLRKNKKFKFAILLEIIIVIISHLLSIIWYEDIMNKKQIYNIFLSKFFLGLASSEKIEKKYLINFLPKNTLYIYTKYLNRVKYFAKFIGFLFSIFIFWSSFFFNKNKLINNYYTFFILISLIQFFIIYNRFKNTFNDDFSILVKNIETNYLLLNNDDNNSNSKIINNNNNIYDDIFTENEQEKIRESDKKFESMNNLERFTELNLIPINIKNLINIYNSKLKKLYNILIYLNSLSIFIIVSFTIIFSVTLFKNKITFFYLLIPFNYLIIDKVHYLFFSDNISKKNFITGLLHILLIIFIIIIMLFSLLPKILVLIFFSFIIIINLIIIKKIKRFISIVFPNNINLNYKFFESNTILKFFGYVSGIVGSLITFEILNLFNLKIEELDKGANLFYYIYFIISGLLIFFGIWIYQWNFDIEKMKLFGRIIKRELYS